MCSSQPLSPLHVCGQEEKTDINLHIFLHKLQAFGVTFVGIFKECSQDVAFNLLEWSEAD